MDPFRPISGQEAFQKSRKVLRSPISTGLCATRAIVLDDEQAQPTNKYITNSEEPRHVTEDPSQSVGTASNRSGVTTPITINTQENEQNAQSSPTHPSRLEQIAKMQESEEESIKKCVVILRKMRMATERQKNISKDVKDGIGELSEQMDVIESCRRIWRELEKTRILEAEKETGVNSTQNVKNLPHGDGETPASSRAKRTASSPAAPVIHKKIKDNGQEGWQSVTYRKSKRKTGKGNQPPDAMLLREDKNDKKEHNKGTRRHGRKLPEAILIKPVNGKSYAEVLKDLKTKVKPEDAEVALRAVRKTKNGSILLEMAEGGNKDKFCEAIRTSLKDTVNVSALKPKTTIEIRDLDALSEVLEVSSAIKELIKNPEEEVYVRVTKANTREQRRAFVTLAAEKAETILNCRRIKIGWTYCRINKVPIVQRCFKCFDTGHSQLNCKGPDRKGEGLCIRCGKKGHKIKECLNPPHCCICVAEGKTPVDHIPGTTKCPSYTAAKRAQ